ncbi:hypothetical protein [Rosistilla oblonga]|uniref:hypothetical protein n=1 Tax=Rosistilla oblonga TaxID=2527990 RepID=UPI003A98002B
MTTPFGPQKQPASLQRIVAQHNQLSMTNRLVKFTNRLASQSTTSEPTTCHCEKCGKAFTVTIAKVASGFAYAATHAECPNCRTWNRIVHNTGKQKA